MKQNRQKTSQTKTVKATPQTKTIKETAQTKTIKATAQTSEPNTSHDTIDPKALHFGLMSVFLIGIGFTIISPIIPFIIAPFAKGPDQQALLVSLLMAVYALCMFIGAPALGALSDTYGRKPILLICLGGSVIGYLFMGIGGSLIMLFLGRLIDGITGGSIGTLFAYFADITPESQRSKYFGWISATSGLGIIIGPTIGGLLAHFGNSVPLYFGAIITFINLVYGYYFMPESLKKENRVPHLPKDRLNPFVQLVALIRHPKLSLILIPAFLLWIPAGAFQAIFSQLTWDTFAWQPSLIGLMFSIMGIQDILAQAFIMPQLLKVLSDKGIATLGMVSELIGYGLIGLSALFTSPICFIIGLFVFAFGDSIFGPAFNGILSQSVSASQQGSVQGGSQSLQALSRIIGPLVGGLIYSGLNHAAPAFMGVLFLSLALFRLTQSKISRYQNHIQ